MSHPSNQGSFMFASPFESWNIKSYKLKQASPTHLHNRSSFWVQRHVPFKENWVFWPGTVMPSSKRFKNKHTKVLPISYSILHRQPVMLMVGLLHHNSKKQNETSGGIFLRTYTRHSTIWSAAFATVTPWGWGPVPWLHKSQHSLTPGSDLDSQ